MRRGARERRVEKTVRPLNSSRSTRGTPSIAARSKRPLKTSAQSVSTRFGCGAGFDFDINQISYLPERDQAVDFSDSYYDVEQAVVTLGDSEFATPRRWPTSRVRLDLHRSSEPRTQQFLQRIIEAGRL